MKKGESKISNIEWVLVICVLFAFDIIQIIIEWLLGWIVIGEVINFILDVFVGMCFGMYLQLRGESLANPKRLAGLVGTMFFEMVPLVQELPLWGLDGIFNMVISKSDKILSTIPGGNMVNQALTGAQANFNPELRKPTSMSKIIENKKQGVSNSTREIRNLDQGLKNRNTENEIAA